MPTPAGKACPVPVVYRRRCLERTLLYRLVQIHLSTRLAQHDDGQGRTVLLAPTYEVFPLICLQCGGTMRIIAPGRC